MQQDKTELKVGQEWNVAGQRYVIVGFDGRSVLVKDARLTKKNFTNARGAGLMSRLDFEEARLL